MEPKQQKATILIVDDQPLMADILARMLPDYYSPIVALDGRQALKLAQQGQVDLILLDVVMPELDGFEVCKALKADPRTSGIPIIFVTASSDDEDESLGLQVGACDYIAKPFKARVVRARIATHLALSSQQRHLEQLVRKRTRELEGTEMEIIRKLGRAAELRDYETGLHVFRVSNYAYHIARAAGLSEAHAELIRTVAPLHDVGKIGIPDQILLKRGPLDDDEWRNMRTHCELGYRIIGDHSTEPLRTAALCAYCHHERWDGTGYPRQLAGEEIPLVARILAVADVFDALTCDRPYKRAWSIPAAVEEIGRGSGSQFDPDLVTAFLAALPEIKEVLRQFAETKDAATTPCPSRESSGCPSILSAA